jgi:hypothetical protein
MITKLAAILPLLLADVGYNPREPVDDPILFFQALASVYAPYLFVII